MLAPNFFQSSPTYSWFFIVSNYGFAFVTATDLVDDSLLLMLVFMLSIFRIEEIPGLTSPCGPKLLIWPFSPLE